MAPGKLKQGSLWNVKNFNSPVTIDCWFVEVHVREYHTPAALAFPREYRQWLSILPLQRTAIPKTLQTT
jgi:hypothetical protein